MHNLTKRNIDFFGFFRNTKSLRRNSLRGTIKEFANRGRQLSMVSGALVGVVMIFAVQNFSAFDYPIKLFVFISCIGSSIFIIITMRRHVHLFSENENLALHHNTTQQAFERDAKLARLLSLFYLRERDVSKMMSPSFNAAGAVPDRSTFGELYDYAHYLASQGHLNELQELIEKDKASANIRNPHSGSTPPSSSSNHQTNSSC